MKIAVLLAYTVRLYRPRAENLNGKFKFPEARPAT